MDIEPTPTPPSVANWATPTPRPPGQLNDMAIEWADSLPDLTGFAYAITDEAVNAYNISSNVWDIVTFILIIMLAVAGVAAIVRAMRTL